MEPKIGLALGSGGARGFAHLGLIRVLQEEKIPIDYIAGSSMGALIGCFFAAGTDIEKLYKISMAFKRKYFLDFTVPKMGFISGKRVKEFIHLFVQGRNIEDFPIPLAVVATDIQSGEKVVFTSGPAADAVRASISIPGILVPEKINGRLLIDGGVIDRVPVSVARQMGADLIIACDVSKVKQDTDIQSIYDVIMQSLDILQMEIVKMKEIDADVMIRPRAEKYSSRAFTNIEEIITIGEEQTRKKIPEIKQAIEKWKETHKDEPQ